MEWIGFLVLTLLPGCWVTFGLSLPGVSRLNRWVIGVALAPIVVCFEFWFLRLVGASFEWTVILLVPLNVPAAYLAFRGGIRTGFANRASMLLVIAAVFVPLLSLVPQILRPAPRFYYGHPWMHTSIIHMVARGDIVPEEPELAGVKLFYPWMGHIYQATLSKWLDSTPLSSYLWTNLVLLICAFGLAIAISAELGAGFWGKITSGVWLFFGLNLAGEVFRRTLPAAVRWYLPIAGEERYTPWMWPFTHLNQIPLGIVMFLALILLSVRETPHWASKSNLFTVGLLLCGVGFFYPIMFPAACAVVAARGLALLHVVGWPFRQGKFQARDLFPILAVILVAGLLSVANYSFISDARVTSAIGLSTAIRSLSKGATVLLVGSPFLAGVFLVFRRCWAAKRLSTGTLLLGALASAFLYVLLDLPFWSNEYKYMFTTFACLAPFPALASEVLISRQSRFPTLAVTTLVLLVAMLYILKIREEWKEPRTTVQMEADGFYIRLGPQEPLSALCDAIRRDTPKETIVVAGNDAVHYPTFAARQLYVPASGGRVFPGFTLRSDTLLLKIRGYSKELVDERRKDLKNLFQPGEQQEREIALGRILSLRRPVAIILNPVNDFGLMEWLAGREKGKEVFRSESVVLWLVQPEPLPGTP